MKNTKSHSQFVKFVINCNHNFYMNNKNLIIYGKRLREVRKQKNLTQEKLAEILGMSPNFIGMIERGERNTTVDNMFRISNALGISLKEFFDKL